VPDKNGLLKENAIEETITEQENLLKITLEEEAK
jgi:hypothetical protein